MKHWTPTKCDSDSHFPFCIGAGGLDSYFLRRDCAAMGAELTAAGAGSATLGASVSVSIATSGASVSLILAFI